MRQRQRPLVLVVDDETTVVHIYQLLLGQEGFDTFPALDGQEAIEAARRFRPDAVLMGVVMPAMDGFTSAEHILRFAPETKFIFISGSADKLRDSYQQMPRLHPNFPLLAKPVPIEDLRPYLASFLLKETHA